jgi:ribosomal protein S18 acetylase RimI-like enzyme
MCRENPELVFREITEAEEACLARFFAHNDVPQTVRQFNPFRLTAEMARTIAQVPRRDHYYGAFLGDRMVGFSMLRGWDEGYSVPSFGILIDRDFQGRGYGSRMILFTVREARRLGCQRVRLTVYSSNFKAFQLYVSHGFVEHSRRRVMIGSEMDEKILMFKDL